MDDIAAQLQQLLSDPNQMAQIAQLAESLGLGAPPAQQSSPPPEDDFGMQSLARLLPLLSKAGGREIQVLQALRPYLPVEDQLRVDRALRAAKLSRLAALAIGELQSGNPGGLL